MVKREIIYRTDENYAYIKVGECPFIKFDLYKLDMIKQYQWGYTIGRLPSAKRRSITKFLFPDIKKPQYKDKNKYNMTNTNVEDLYKSCWIENDICYIPLSNGKIAQCDSKFFDLVNYKVWKDARTGIVARPGSDHLKSKSITLKNLLFPSMNFIKFIDGDRYNYQSKNVLNGLRQCWIENNICYIPLSNGKIAMCDAKHYEIIKNRNWYLNKNRYACAAINGKKALEMHKFLYPYIKVVDHINRNRLDNRSTNIREVDRFQNAFNRTIYKNNTSGYKGVSFCKIKNKYSATIGYQNKSIHIGYYKNKEDAARAYDKKAQELFGEYAALNFPNFKGENNG